MEADKLLDLGRNLDVEQLNWLMVAVIIIIAGYMIKGGADGFIKTVFEMFSVLAAAAAASFMAPYINTVLKSDAPLFAFLIGYFVCWLVLKYACAALDIISRLPIINELNKAAGLFAGLFRGIIMVWILFIIITVFRETAWGNMALGLIEDSHILKTLYQSNLILKLAKVFF